MRAAVELQLTAIVLGIGVACAALLLVFGCASAPRVLPASTEPLLVGVNGGFYGEVLSADTYARLQAWSTRGVILRLPVRTRDEAQAAIAAAAPYPGLRLLLLVEALNLALVDAIADLPAWGIGLGNECDLADIPPARWGYFAIEGYRHLRAASFRGHILACSVFTVDDQRLLELVDAGVGSWPADLDVDLHWYGDASDAVIGRVQDFLGARRPIVSEFGMAAHSAADHAAQAAYYEAQLVQFQRAGVHAAIAYQLNDGPGPTDLDAFGLRPFGARPGAPWFPVADVLARWGAR